MQAVRSSAATTGGSSTGLRHILAFEGDSKVVWFEGNYSDYEADRKNASARKPTSPIAFVIGSSLN